MIRARFTRIVAAVLAVSAIAVPALAADETAVIARRVIYPGETIDSTALTEVKLRPGNRVLTAIALFPEQIEGKVARRTLLPGKLIPISAVREAYLVEAGAPVEVNFVQGGLRISTMGTPLQPGAAGDLVKVKNVDSGAIFTGKVMPDGTIGVVQR